MQSLSNLERQVLLAACDDYEAPHTLVADLSRDLGVPLRESEVLSAFMRLASLGLVQGFRYSQAEQRFVQVGYSELPALPDPWFLAARKDRA